MGNQYYGDFLALGKIVQFDRKKRSKKYKKNEIDLLLGEVKDIIKNNINSFYDKCLEENYIEGLFDMSVISAPFYSQFIEDLMKEGFYKSKLGFSYIFEKAIKEHIKKDSNNPFLEIADENKFDYYYEKIVELKDRIISQIDRLIIQDITLKSNDDVIINVTEFKKEFLYDLPKNLKGFICKKLERPELISELSDAYEIPILMTPRSYTTATFAIIDGINKKSYMNPNKDRIKKAIDIRNSYTFVLGEDPIYKSEEIKFYASLVDKKDIDRIVSSTWYEGLALFKTEYMYITKGYSPSFDEQVELYSHLLKSFKDKIVQIRIPSFDEVKSLDYEGELFTELEYIRDFSRIFFTNISAIKKASEVTKKRVAIVIPKLRMGIEVAKWKELIHGYLGKSMTENENPLFSIMLETESALLYYEDYRYVDSIVYGLDNYIDECMEKSKFEKIDFEEFMLQAFPDLEGSHQYYRRTGIRLLHFLEGNILKDPKILRKFMNKGFKHFIIPLSHVKKVGEVLFEKESIKGKYKEVYAKRKKKKENDK
jgi:phosphoenolpyruvate-protein phosphotransferase (PTS system enzyme I)